MPSLGEAEGANLADSKVPLLAAAVSGSANSSLDTAGLRAHVHVHVQVTYLEAWRALSGPLTAGPATDSGLPLGGIALARDLGAGALGV